MKIKKNGVTINLSESDISRISKTLLKEQRADIIQKGDTDLCLIVCDTKHAKIGSNGPIVKQIQHALADGGFNVPRGGGGMDINSQKCAASLEGCDGKFRTHTRNAVKEFQKKYKLSTDGIVGPLTLKKMCEILAELKCPDCKCDDSQTSDPPGEDTDPNRKKDPNRNKDPEIDIDIFNPSIGDNECATVIACLRKVMTGTPGLSAVGTNKWELFLKCIGKLKDIVFPPKGPVRPDAPGCNPKHCFSGKPKTSEKYMYKSVISYYYDPITGKCQSFPVGAAPFHDLKQCQKCCEGKKKIRKFKPWEFKYPTGPMGPK